MKKYVIVISLIIASSPLLSVFAQGTTAPLTLLRQGLMSFNKGNYNQALADFEQLTGFEMENPYLDAGFYLTAKTNIRIKHFISAQNAVDELRLRFPNSIYLDYAEYLEAEILYAQKKDLLAYKNLFYLYGKCSVPGLKSLAKDKLTLLLKGMNTGQLMKIRSKVGKDGRDFIDELLTKKGMKSKIIVLTAPEDTTAELFVNGIELALNLYREQSGSDELELTVIETPQRLLDEYLTVKNLNEQSVVAVISLNTGTSSLITAAAGSALDVPFFFLMDNTPDIWKTGDNIWQLQPDLASMGAALADYTVRAMGVERFVTIAPLDDSRIHFAEAFIRRAEVLEVEIAGQEWYYTDALDLGNNFKTLRRIGFRCAFDDSLITLLEQDSLYIPLEDSLLIPDSLIIPVDSMYFTVDSLSDTLLNQLWSNYQKSMIELARFQRVEVDSNDIPLSCFDGFVFPLAADEIDMYVPQFAFYNFKTNLFSVLSAFPPAVLEKYGHYLTGLKVVGWGRRDRSHPAFSLLTDRFFTFKGDAPTDEEVIGYDAMNLILNLTSMQYQAKLGEHKEELSFQGVSYDFIFPPGKRNNQSMNFYEFDGKFFTEMEIMMPDSSEMEAVTGEEGK
ncbi:MAG: hypothetical protein HQ591_09500 [candidate division Zixibacteria bacterium]|nr:hypothetical protein [Candidatus Tariuqbacter arcticus]